MSKIELDTQLVLEALKQQAEGNDPLNEKKAVGPELVVMQRSHDANGQIVLTKNESFIDDHKTAEEATTKKIKKKTRPQISFGEDPNTSTSFSALYKTKVKLVPDSVIKDIRISDHLVACILRARGNTAASFGHLKKDRFDKGLKTKIKPDFEPHITSDQMPKVQERIKKFESFLMNCGHVENLKDNQKMSLSQFLYTQAQNAESFGRFATEFVYDTNDKGEDVVTRFRPVDAGTIYHTYGRAEMNSMGPSLRSSARSSLERISGEKVDMEKFFDAEYPYIQVVNNVPVQCFVDKEMSVFNMYPCSDIELNGYPVTPIDNVLGSITTHMNIITYNRLYFQNGRAAKGFVILKSDNSNEQMLNAMQQQYNATINGVGNSFKVPIFGIDKEDDVQWVPTMSSTGDAEFQFLYDQVARNILSSFNISPEEVPGYAHLAKGTSQQSLAESSSEYKLTAARDGGLRPFISKIEAFLNDIVMPRVDPELAQLCTISLEGLDQESREQESVRLQEDMPIHMTFDDVLSTVDKAEVGERMGGAFPFNQQYQNIINQHQTVGDIIAHFYGDPSAYVDPTLNYRRDPMFFQYLQMLQQANPYAFAAYFASKKHSMETLKFLIADLLAITEE